MNNPDSIQNIDDPILNLIDFPELRQTYNYDCGVTSLQQVLCYYGIEIRESVILEEAKEIDAGICDKGMKLLAVKEYAEKKGLKAEIKENLTPAELITYIDNKFPVIVLLQAWRDEQSPKNWSDDYLDGHYVVAIGYTKEKIIFEDPSSFNRTFLSFEELAERWHDSSDDDETKRIYGVGIIISGVPKFKSNAIKHMD